MSKFSKAFTDNAKDLDIVIPMYNLRENSKNYFITSASWRIVIEAK